MPLVCGWSILSTMGAVVLLPLLLQERIVRDANAA